MQTTLQKLRDIFFDSSRWVKHFYAKHSDGNPIGAYSPNASCFCLSGAILSYHLEWIKIPTDRERTLLINSPEYKELVRRIVLLFPERIDNSRKKGYVEQFNDHSDTTFSDIEKVLSYDDNTSPQSSP